MDALETSYHAARAAAISIVPGLGHLYIGEKRGYRLLLLTVAAGGIFHLNWIAGFTLYAGLLAFSAADTYLTVKRGKGLW